MQNYDDSIILNQSMKQIIHKLLRILNFLWITIIIYLSMMYIWRLIVFCQKKLEDLNPSFSQEQLDEVETWDNEIENFLVKVCDCNSRVTRLDEIVEYYEYVIFK